MLSKYFWLLLVIVWSTILLCGCTISLQNVSTAGKSEDIIDDQQKADADLKPNVSLSSI